MLHGERSQGEREEAVGAFRSGKAQVGGCRWLVCLLLLLLLREPCCCCVFSFWCARCFPRFQD